MPAAKRVRAERLHLTLHFLGDVPRERLPALGEALSVPLRAVPIEARVFSPHVTIARHAGTTVRPATGPRLRWPVNGYALVESRPQPRGGYQILQTYR